MELLDVFTEQWMEGPDGKIVTLEHAKIACCCHELDFVKRVNAMVADGWRPTPGTYRQELKLSENPHPNPPSYKIERSVEMERRGIS